MDTTMREKLLSFDTCIVSDALDALGVTVAMRGIAALAHGQRMCGDAFTVRFVGQAGERPAVAVADYLGQVGAGQVVVIDNGARDDCGVWGGLTTTVARARGIEATVLDGACRDVPEILAAGYPVFSKGSCPASGKGRVVLDTVNEVVSCGGVTVAPGDIILGDETGVVSLPPTMIEDALAKVRELKAKENAIIASIGLV